MFVYLVGNREHCKIGMARNPELRVDALDSPMLPFPIKLLAKYDAGIEAPQLEQALHKEFDSLRLRGEWFRGISPADFLLLATVEHKKCVVRPVRVEEKIKRDPRVVWAEEWAFGERMLALIDSLERNTRC